MIVAGVLAVYLEKARKEGAIDAMNITRQIQNFRGNSNAGDGILRF